MNKINQLNDTAQSVTPQKTTTKNQKTDEFKNALAKAISTKESDTTQSSPANGLKEIASVDFQITDQSDIVSGKTDRLLDMLDSYVEQLEDPSIPLKNIAPVLEQIKDDAGRLQKDALNLKDSDNSLKEIATQTVTAAQTEYLKFQRGDYVS